MNDENDESVSVPAFNFDRESLLKERLATASKYIVSHEVGRGGMGAVYEAFDCELRRNVAIKLILRKRIAGKSEYEVDKEVARLRSEARFGAKLQHTNIVNIFRFIILDENWKDIISIEDDDELDGEPIACIVMQLVAGQSLSSLFYENRDKEMQPSESLHATALQFFGEENIGIDSAKAVSMDKTDEDNFSKEFAVNSNVIQSKTFINHVAKVGRQLASAMAHSHSNQILHNDIKPQNVLVDGDGNAWLTDFGVAGSITDKPLKSIGGTSGYMAPETEERIQNPSTDIYSIGATLYRMLTLEVPHPRNSDVVEPTRKGMARRLLEKNPAVPVDLAAVIEKSIELAPTDRYTSAEELHDDLVAFLSGQSVRANPVGSFGELSRWALRNRLAAALAFLLLTVSILGFAVSSWLANRANQSASVAKTAEHAANLSATRSSGILSIVKDSFESVDPAWGANAKTPASDVLVVAMNKAKDSELDDEGLSELLESISTSLIGIGEYQLAIDSATELVETRRRFNGEGSKEFWLANETLANANDLAGNLETSLELFQKSYAAIHVLLGEHDPITLRTLSNLATANYKNGNVQTALDQGMKAFELQKAHTTDVKDRLQTASNLSVIFQRAGKYDKAIEVLEEARELSLDELDEDDPVTLRIYSNLADAYSSIKQTENVVAMNREILALRKSKLGEDHPETLESMVNLSAALNNEDGQAESLELQLKCLERVKEKLGEEHPLAMVLLNNLAGWYLERGDFDNAIQQFEDVCRIRESELGKNHPDTLLSKYNLAGTYDRAGKLDKAIPLLEETLAARTAILKRDHPHIPGMMNRLAVVYWKTKQYPKAVALYEKTVALTEETLGKDHPDTLFFLANLGVNQLADNQLDAAIKSLERVYSAREEHPSLAPYRQPLRTAYVKVKNTKKFTRFIDEEIGLARGKHGQGSLEIANKLTTAGKELLNVEAYEKADELLSESLQIRRDKNPDDWQTFETISILGEARFYLKKFKTSKSLIKEANSEFQKRIAEIPEAKVEAILKSSRKRMALIEQMKVD